MGPPLLRFRLLNKPRLLLTSFTVEESICRWLGATTSESDLTVEISLDSLGNCDGLAFNFLFHSHFNFQDGYYEAIALRVRIITGLLRKTKMIIAHLKSLFQSKTQIYCPSTSILANSLQARDYHRILPILKTRM